MKEMVFISRVPQLKMTVRPIAYHTDPISRRTTLVDSGHDIVFENGLFTTSDPVEIKFLMDSPKWGVKIFPAAGRPEEARAQALAAAKVDPVGVIPGISGTKNLGAPKEAVIEAQKKEVVNKLAASAVSMGKPKADKEETKKAKKKK